MIFGIKHHRVRSRTETLLSQNNYLKKFWKERQPCGLIGHSCFCLVVVTAATRLACSRLSERENKDAWDLEKRGRWRVFRARFLHLLNSQVEWIDKANKRKLRVSEIWVQWFAFLFQLKALINTWIKLTLGRKRSVSRFFLKQQTNISVYTYTRLITHKDRDILYLLKQFKEGSQRLMWTCTR